MAQTYLSRFLARVRRAEEELSRLFDDLTALAIAELLRNADEDGIIPRNIGLDVRQAIAALVVSEFVARTVSGREPFLVTAGVVQPLSPYSRILQSAIEDVVAIPIEQHAALMTRNLQGAPDVLAVLQRAPFQSARLVQYDPPHLWVDPNGHRLSDRIWRTADVTRRKLDRLLEEGIAQGRSARSMARDLEAFLQPGRRLLRTNTPYGTDGSFDAMRLARTEISRAHAQSAEQSALANPFVSGISVVLSQSHPKPDICDDAAAASPFPKDDIPAEYQIPLHPQCVTPGQSVETEGGPVLIENIKAGDKVLTHEGRYGRVKAAWSTPHDAPVYQFKTPCGQFELTGNHPVLLRRGWVEAKSVKVRDEILYATAGVFADLPGGISKDVPTLTIEPGVSSPIVVGFALVPSLTVALNSNLDIGHSEVNEEATYAIFSLIEDSGAVKGVYHSTLSLSGVSKTLVSDSQQHGHEAGVVLELCPGYFPSDIGALSGTIFSTQVKRLVRFAHRFAGGFSPATIIVIPSHLNGAAHAPHGNVAQAQQLAQHAVSDSVSVIDLDAAELLVDIDFIEKVSQWAALLGLDTQLVPFRNSESVVENMSGGRAGHFEATNGANVGDGHDNLLSLSPDSKWGTGSGSPVVSGLITPAQALLKYITIEGIEQREYRGPVYNMEVEGDNSYTVNGAVVHNCLCYYSYVMVEERADTVDRLRASLRNVGLTPLQLKGFQQALLRGE